MPFQRNSQNSLLWITLLFVHFGLLIGVWAAVRIGRPRFFGLALYIVAAAVLVDILLILCRSPTEAVMNSAQDVRVPTVFLIANVGIVALLGKGVLFYAGVTTTLVLVLLRLFAREGRANVNVGDLGLVCGSSILLLSSKIFTVSYFVSTADTINHTTAAIVLRNGGFLSAISSSRYFFFSAFHMLASTGMRFTQLSPRILMGVLVICFFQIALLAVFLFFGNWGGSNTLALIGTVLVAINISFLHYGSVAHYQSMSFVLFCVFLVLLTGRNWSVPDVTVTALIGTAWVTTHHVSVLMALGLIPVPVGYLVTQIWARGREINERATVFMFVAFCLIFGFYWTIVTTQIREVLSWAFFGSSAAEGLASSFYIVQPVDSAGRLLTESLPFFVDSFHYSFLLSLAVLGVIFFVTTDKYKTTRWRLTFLGFIPAGLFYFPNPVWIPLEGLLPFNRVRLMVLPFLMLIPAAGFRYGMRPSGTRLHHIGVVLFTAALIFTTVTSGMTHPGFTDFAGIEKGSQEHLTDEELSTAEFTLEYLDAEQRVSSRSLLQVYLRQYAWVQEDQYADEQFDRIEVSRTDRRLVTGPGLTIVSINAFTNNGIQAQVTDIDGSQGTDSEVSIPVYANNYQWERTNTSVVYSNGNTVIQYKRS